VNNVFRAPESTPREAAHTSVRRFGAAMREPCTPLPGMVSCLRRALGDAQL
jgi:hypothetical protein